MMGGAAVRRGVSVLALVVSLALASCGGEATVPTHAVERRDFEHRVTAEGALVAGRTTQLTVPVEVRATVRLAWLLAEGTAVEEGDVVARFDPKSMREKLEEGRLDLATAERRIDQSRVGKEREIVDLESDARVADLELAHSRRYKREDSEVFSRRELLEDAIDEELASQRREHAEANAATQESLARTEIEILEISRRQANDMISEAETGLDALEVKAPHAGLFTWARDWRGDPITVGMEMFRGRPLGEIPDLDSLEVEAWVLEADAGGLEAGQPAEVVVEAHPSLPLTAKVKRVEPVAKTRTRGSPVQYFGVILELEGLGPRARELLKPGQRVRATLFLERVDDALVVPRQALFKEDTADEDGEYLVWRRDGDGFERVAVEVGATGLGSAVVKRGLDEGDLVALRPPSGSSLDAGGGDG